MAPPSVLSEPIYPCAGWNFRRQSVQKDPVGTTSTRMLVLQVPRSPVSWLQHELPGIASHLFDIHNCKCEVQTTFLVLQFSRREWGIICPMQATLLKDKEPFLHFGCWRECTSP